MKESSFDESEGAQSCYFKFLLIEPDDREDVEVTGDVASDVPLMEDWPPYTACCTKEVNLCKYIPLVLYLDSFPLPALPSLPLIVQ